VSGGRIQDKGKVAFRGGSNPSPREMLLSQGKKVCPAKREIDLRKNLAL